MKELSVEDQIYLCKYHDVINAYDLRTTIGIKKDEMEQLIEQYKKNGLYEQYRNLSEEEYEQIIKKEEKKDKCTKILDKYGFDKNKKGYITLKNVMRECLKYNDSTQLSLEKVFRKLADKQGIKSYIINNDCKRMLDNTYLEKQKLFEEKGYYKKPTLREFIIQELKIQGANNKKNASNEKDECINASKENVICDITPNIGDIENTFVKVSVKTMMECAYYKGYLDRMLEANCYKVKEE